METPLFEITFRKDHVWFLATVSLCFFMLTCATIFIRSFLNSKRLKRKIDQINGLIDKSNKTLDSVYSGYLERLKNLDLDWEKNLKEFKENQNKLKQDYEVVKTIIQSFRKRPTNVKRGNGSPARGPSPSGPGDKGSAP
jgi:hypothetical protein